MEQSNTVTTSSLFHTAALKQALRQDPAPSEHKSILQDWSKNLAALNQKDKASRLSTFLQKIIVDLLGYSSPGTLKDLTGADGDFFDAKLGSLGNKDNTNIVLVKLMDAGRIDTDASNDGSRPDTVDEARKLAKEAGSGRFLLLTNLDEVRIYSLTNRRKTYESFSLTSMADDTAAYQRFVTLLGAQNVLAGNTEALLKASFENYLKDKMTHSRHRTLKEVYGEFLPGLPYAMDAAFVVDYPTYGRFMQEEPAARDILPQFFPADSYRQWFSDDRPYWLIYTPKGKVDIDRYPVVKAHLETFRADLEKRDGDQKWYEHHQLDNTDLPQGTGLRVATGSLLPWPGFIITKNTSQFSEGSHYINNADYSLFALLNSPAMAKLITLVAPKTESGMYELSKDLLEALPIPFISGENSARLGRWSHFTMEGTQDLNYLVKHVIAMAANDLSPENTKLPPTEKLQNWFELDFDAFREEVRLSFKVDIPEEKLEEWSEHFYHEQGTYYQLYTRMEETALQMEEVIHSLFDLDEDDIETIKASR